MQILQVKRKLLTHNSFIQLLKRLNFPIEVITYMCTSVHMHTHTHICTQSRSCRKESVLWPKLQLTAVT